jgi:hypothetical protein
MAKKTKSQDHKAEPVPPREQIVLSGTKPTGTNLHLGNYFGALRQFVDLQESHDKALYFHRRLSLDDLHS